MHCSNGVSKAGQPSDKIDWPNLKFGLMPTNGYIRYTWVRKNFDLAEMRCRWSGD